MSAAVRLEHVNISVTDLDTAVAFWCEVLGFELRWRGTSTLDLPAAHVGDEDFYLALFETGTPGRAPYDYEAVGVNHFGFVVEDLDSVVAALGRLGCRAHLVPDYEPGRRAYFFDPDGNEFELVEYDDESSR